MKRINYLQLILGAVITVLAVSAVQAKESSVDVTYYALSKHFNNEFDYNESNHKFIGLSYNLADSGHTFSYATFNNSYNVRSHLISWGYRWQLAQYVESSLNVGATTGYGYCDVCPIVEAGIKYTKFKYIQPKVSFFAGAAVLSFSARF